MSLIPQFKTELQYIPTVKACLKLSQVDCFCLRLKGSLATSTYIEKRRPCQRSSLTHNSNIFTKHKQLTQNAVQRK